MEDTEVRQDREHHKEIAVLDHNIYNVHSCTIFNAYILRP